MITQHLHVKQVVQQSNSHFHKVNTQPAGNHLCNVRVNMHEGDDSNVIVEKNDENVVEETTGASTNINELPPTSSRDDEVDELVTKLNNIPNNDGDEEVFWQTSEWKIKKKHIFILSSAGKPIYSR
jgi:hypothetical protein